MLVIRNYWIDKIEEKGRNGALITLTDILKIAYNKAVRLYVRKFIIQVLFHTEIVGNKTVYIIIYEFIMSLVLI